MTQPFPPSDTTTEARAVAHLFRRSKQTNSPRRSLTPCIYGMYVTIHATGGYIYLTLGRQGAKITSTAEIQARAACAIPATATRTPNTTPTKHGTADVWEVQYVWRDTAP